MRRRTFLAAVGATALAGCLQLENVPVVGDGPDADADEPPLQFRNVTEGSGFDYSHRAGAVPAIAAMTRAGIYVADFDNDGREDLLAMGGETPVLFRNTGDGFEPSGALPSLPAAFGAALFFDFDNDGWEDLLLLGAGEPPYLLENDRGTYREASAGFEEPLDVPIGAAAADATGDGCPDLFIIQNGDWNSSFPNGLETLDLPAGGDNGNPNRLYRGDGERFTDVTADSGIAGERWSLATSFVDLTGDGRPDIHVANDFNRDVIYLNRGDGTFDRRELGEGTNRNGMASAVEDITGDGRLDIFVTNIWYPTAAKAASQGTMAERTDGNNLLVNQGDGRFEDRAAALGVDRGGWGWAATAVDFDNDTELDLVHATQRLDFTDLRSADAPDELRTIHDDHSFYRYPAAWHGTGEGFDSLDPAAVGFDRIDARGMAHVDFDRDGRADLVIANARGAFQLYRNEGTRGMALQVDVRGTEATPALGTRVTVSVGEIERVAVRDSKTDFLSQSTRVLHFGVGDHASADVEVAWPDGTHRTFEGVATGQRIEVTPDGIEARVQFDETA